MAPKHRPQLPPSKLEETRSVQPRQLARVRGQAATMVNQLALTALVRKMEVAPHCFCPHPRKPPRLKHGNRHTAEFRYTPSHSQMRQDLLFLLILQSQSLLKDGSSYTVRRPRGPRTRPFPEELVCLPPPSPPLFEAWKRENYHPSTPTTTRPWIESLIDQASMERRRGEDKVEGDDTAFCQPRGYSIRTGRSRTCPLAWRSPVESAEM